MVFVCLFTTAEVAFAQTDASENQTPLSGQIQTIIDTEGAAAAGSWFKTNWASHKDQYSVDTQAMMALMSDYLTAGDSGAAQAVGEITASIMQDTMAEAMQANAPEMMAQIKAQQQADAKNQVKADLQQANNQAKTAHNNRGEPRTDLQRFAGLYGVSDGRQLFVTQSCDGYLVVGAMWGDVAPWWMRPVADAGFDYSDSFFSLAIEFSVDANGDAVQLSHDLDGLSSPLPKLGALPDDFPDCTERAYR